jgi:uncharacterized damage-inducible protein DinB
MRTTRSAIAATAVLVAAALSASTLHAQGMKPSVITDLMNDVEQAQQKIVGLARAIPEDKYSWRPGEGVRSVAEMFKHIASDNYLIPTAVGAKPPGESGITSDYTTASAFEKRTLSKDAIIAELDKSFSFLKTTMAATSDARLKEEVDIFGGKGTVQQLWVLATTHLHEHLGQGIAYARTNGIVPPWNR